MPTDEATVAVYRGGFVANPAVVACLLAIEGRGARFLPQPDGSFRVERHELVTAEERAFLRAHLAEARRVVHYQADDAHLFSDTRLAQPARVPEPLKETV